MAGPLGLRKPTDDRHLRLYSLTNATIPTVPTPCVMGVNWYASWDTPEAVIGNAGSRTYWVGRQADWGRVRGGHAICIASPHLSDLVSWWEFYDQGNEGACVGFSLSRAMSNLNRKRYAGDALYQAAKKIDDWPGEDYDGTSVRAGADVLRTLGADVVRAGRERGFALTEGITANRWGRDVMDVAMCLSPQDNGSTVMERGYVEIVNSWGKSGYPHKVRVPLDALDRLIFREDGEVTVMTDR